MPPKHESATNYKQGQNLNPESPRESSPSTPAAPQKTLLNATTSVPEDAERLLPQHGSTEASHPKSFAGSR